jgi:hypothetical protein
LEPEGFERCFLNWVKSLIKIEGDEVIAIDGKTEGVHIKIIKSLFT